MHTSIKPGRRTNPSGAPQPGRRLFWLASLVALLLGLAPRAWAQCEKLVWQDEFNGPTLDPTKWEREVNGNGQGTGQLDYATDRPQNAYLENGNLVLKLIKEEYKGLHYTSARLRTYKKLDTQYGRIEARVKGVYSQGNGFAFWMLGSDYETVTWPKCGEVDIFENTGRLPGHNIGTAHFAGPDGRDAISQGSYDLPAGQRWADDFHVTGIEWSPTYIKWYIDDPNKPYHVLDLTNPINGYRPFNRPFFVLLSIGMGGSYSGPPDATTVTPMTATIDYVRVYKGDYSTYVSGDDRVYRGEQGKPYAINTVNDGTNKYAWTVPAGASIVAGQGTGTISVDWGANSAGGPVSVQVTSGCNSAPKSYALNVTTEAPFVADKVFENFESPPAFTYTTITGTLSKGVPNPLVNSVNPSPKVGKYLRNAGALYDVIGMQHVDASPAGDFVIGQRRILMDVYTDAAPGTRVSLNFENSKAANAGNYPTGRYANFEAVTTKQGTWETLEFNYTGSPDAGTGASNVDQWILLFAPVTNSGNVFYYDNLRTGRPGGPPRVLDTRVLQNFDGNDQLTKDFANGQYTVQANPAPGGVNTSATVAKYVRDAGTAYDALVYKTLAITDGRPFRLGTSTVAMDVYSDAPVGTRLSLNFEISSIANGSNYPQGRYANFEAVTTKQNQWETVTFALSSVPDRGASDAAVDKLVLLFNPVTNTGNTYYLDNLRINSTAPKESLVLANVLEDYDANDLLTLNAAGTTGTYSPKIANPKPNGVNPSANVAKYVRNATAQYDFLILNKNAAVLNAKALRTRQQKFALDVYTDAPAGTPILLGLDASPLLGKSETSGKHSNYSGTTTVQGAWHTVYFTFGSQPDSSVPDDQVDHVAILFELGKLTGTTYYIDNLRTVNVVQQPTLTTVAVTPALAQRVAVGQKVQFAAQGQDQLGANLAAGVLTWAVSGGGTIDANGLFTATTNGAFKVTATANGVAGQADVLVGQALGLTKLTVDPVATFVYQGGTLTLTARGFDQTGAALALTPTWTVTGAPGVSVSPGGVLTASASATGTATVKASSGALAATATITVRTPAAPDSLTLTPLRAKVYLGDTRQYAVTALDQYRNPIAAAATWTVGGGGSISANGLFTATTLGTFAVKVQAGAAVATTYVSVVPKPQNLALGKPARASSVQNSNLSPFYLTDGTTTRTNPDTRWASVGPTTDANGVIIKDDPQWVRIDLGQRYDLSRAVLFWEAAYAKAYTIEVADDTLQARRRAYVETAGDGNVDDVNLLAGTAGRYVWLTCTGRGTPYGYSLYEMQVFGLPHQDPALQSIIVTPNFSTVAANKSVAFAAAGFDQFGNNSALAPTWTASGGTINAGTGAFTAAAGSYVITASSGGVRGTATLTVTSGSTPPPPTPPTAGPNLALNKPARASSLENGAQFPAAAAVDGNYGTRWSSARTDNAWLRVDLGASYSVNRVKLTWEGALGKDYVVEIAPDTVNWTPLKTVTGNTALKNEWTGLAGTGRYVRLRGVARGTGYGYSLYELEVYGTAAGTNARTLATAAAAAPESAEPLGLYPNPVTGTAALTGVAAYPATVGIYDVKGARVGQLHLAGPADAQALDFSGLGRGLYLLRISSPKATQTQRLVKE